MKKVKRTECCWSRGVSFGVCALLFLGSGCVVPPEGIPTLEGTEQEDIPVPGSFELRQSYSPDLSGVEPGARFRSWVGEYVGETSSGEVVPWYITEMRSHEWAYRGMVNDFAKMCAFMSTNIIINLPSGVIC